MIELRGKHFDWDRDKSLRNIEKHGVSFKVAATAFFDPNAIIFTDEDHSQYEDRFIIIGFSKSHSLLTVCHCYRDGNNTIRIISARKATNFEQEIYGGEV